MLDGLIAALQQAPTAARIIAGVAAAAGLVYGFVALRRYRMVQDVPTARIRSAPQGRVELVGRAEALPGEPVVSPLSGVPCCWYRYRIDRRTGTDNRWRPVEQGVSDGLFLLRDETGACVIDPEGARVFPRHRRRGYGVGQTVPPATWRADEQAGVLERMVGGLASGLNVFGARFRYVEEVVLPGDPLYALGWFRTVDGGDREAAIDARVGELLREWKRRPETLRERFDHDRDGRIDPREWEDARRAARLQAEAEAEAEDGRAAPVHLLARPSEGPYLLSARSEADLVRHQRRQAVGGFALFLLALAALGVMFGG